MKRVTEAMPTDKMPKEKSTANFRFPKGAKCQPEGFKSLAADDEITVITKGRVSAFSDNSSPWNEGKDFTLEMTSCEVEVKQKGTSLEDALEAAKKVKEA